MIDQLKNSDGDVKVPRELRRQCLTLLEELGRGAFGLVYKGLLEEPPNPGFLVAVKSLHDAADEKARQELLEEAAVMAQFNHRNVVKLVGVVTVGRPILVVIEFCEKGALKGYLEKHDLTQHQKLRFALDAARGLEHIHAYNFVHRDVAARNVLVSSDLTAKVADFGLAREADGGAEETYYRATSSQIPIRWTAPEAMEERKFSEKSDVWAGGILFYEILTRAALPYDGWSNQRVWVEVCAGYKLQPPTGTPTELCDLLNDMWSMNPKERPDFSGVVERLEELLSMSLDGGAFGSCLWVVYFGGSRARRGRRREARRGEGE
ncbi:uncharacterized protein MONBRDRAFT_15893 [Monosiga brevicollis MX1]|uniref:Protein kinase domain-containing protein n=1 Tax=Monosiga brevicollis TaxID=81824 RepID=A9UW04_MONBE|nr:uncharacterized protein MONBRDRAFT_15893 [Monosiga brevicollis MX1]EDQ90683.1 predicted protein [Monosiga brevicollis MX1]|eukprot:XP_001744734.1 hypothetical protein [Monosiga brevicollis MX1]